MTTIIGYRMPDGVWLAADGRATHRDYIYPNQSVPKLYRFGRWGAGFAGGGHVKRQWEALLDEMADCPEPNVLLDLLWATYREHGLLGSDDGKQCATNADCQLLLTDGEKLWEVGSASSCIEIPAFTAIGSGCEFAQGALAALSAHPNTTPVDQALALAIQVAGQFDTGTGGSITLLKIPNPMAEKLAAE